MIWIPLIAWVVMVAIGVAYHIGRSISLELPTQHVQYHTWDYQPIRARYEIPNERLWLAQGPQGAKNIVEMVHHQLREQLGYHASQYAQFRILEDYLRDSNIIEGRLYVGVQRR